MNSSSNKVIFAALAGNSLIALTKFIAGALTGSSAILSEGVHSLVDTGNQLLLLHGIRQSRKPPDAQYPFGHGKEVYFWSFVVAIIVFAAGAGVSIYEGIIHILSPVAARDVYVNYIVLGLAMVFEGASWFLALKEFSRQKGEWSYVRAVHRGKDPSTFMVLFEDSAAISGIIVAFLGIFLSETTGNPVFDGAASIVIGLILAGTASWLAYETKSLLIGESANREVVQKIRDVLLAFPEIKHVNEILTMHMGPDFILVNISVDFIDPISSADVETTVTRMDRKIKDAYPLAKRIFIEAEAWRTKEERTGRSDSGGAGYH